MIKTVLLILLCASYLFGADYKALQEYKENYKAKSNVVEFRSVEKESKYKNYVQIIYNDINKMNTDMLQSKYGLYLWQCIVDGVCVFEYKGTNNIEFIIEKIKSEQKDIKYIKKYGQFQFIPF